MVSTSQGVTAALIGIFSSIALMFYGDRNLAFLDFKNQDQSRPLSMIEEGHYGPMGVPNPSCEGVLAVQSISGLRNRIVLVDTHPSAEMEKAKTLSQKTWEETGECRVGFVDFVRFPKLAAALSIHEVPQWISTEMNSEYHASFMASYDCLLTSIVWRSMVQNRFR